MSAANAGTLNLRVLDMQSGAPIPGASVYAYFASPVLTRTDGSGKAALITPEAGEFYVAAYLPGYLPMEKNFTIKAGQVTEGTISLPAGEVAIGEIRTERLSLEKMLEMGIDINDHENKHVFNFEVILTFQGEPLPKQTYTVSSSGKFRGGGGGG
ncbi:MAG: carboxypeptidase-like regulatory domain-containing protein, partial [Clostridiales bacterium]|nr:carboxypeptidase-like regulatory domain-containing protein [Clostridiales bacterium]